MVIRTRAEDEMDEENDNRKRLASLLSEVAVLEGTQRARMSVAAFHHNFKLMTASSPLQYLKRIRLDRARRLMVHNGHNASTAARAVGYESRSQFSREFKRLFGMTPVEEAELARTRLVAS
jgi:AraC-like DNA-binding protein